MASLNWDTPMDDQLIDLLSAGHTTTDIALTLGKSRNAVSGRIFRLRQTRPDEIPAAGSLPKAEVAARNSRPDKSKPKPAPKLVKTPTKPTQPENSPIPFIQLEVGQCAFCVEDSESPVSSEMMCCGAPTIEPAAREGDRRKSHCDYHYRIVTDRSSFAKRFIKNTSSVPSEKAVKS